MIPGLFLFYCSCCHTHIHTHTSGWQREVHSRCVVLPRRGRVVSIVDLAMLLTLPGQKTKLLRFHCSSDAVVHLEVVSCCHETGGFVGKQAGFCFAQLSTCVYGVVRGRLTCYPRLTFGCPSPGHHTLRVRKAPCSLPWYFLFLRGLILGKGVQAVVWTQPYSYATISSSCLRISRRCGAQGRILNQEFRPGHPWFETIQCWIKIAKRSERCGVRVFSAGVLSPCHERCADYSPHLESLSSSKKPWVLTCWWPTDS